MDFIDVSKFSKCSCGINIEDTNCKSTDHYSGWGWFLWTMGATAVPSSVDFYCNNCNKVFMHLTDSELIKYYLYYKKN